MIRYTTIAPHPGIASLVRLFWTLESDEPYTHHSMADVCGELIFHYHGTFTESGASGETNSFISGLHAPTQHVRQFTTKTGFGIFGVYLYPHAIPVLFDLPAAELLNEMPDLSLLAGAEGNALHDRVMLACDNTERAAILTGFIKQRLMRRNYKTLPVFSSIETIIRQKGIVKVKEVASDHFLSERQFERQFKHYAGFSPKLFARIVRFQSALAQYGRPELSLTGIAYECGYYDQSHFIHDFKEFSGHHPRHYFSGGSAATAWRD